jgi:hypothetical protein
VGLERLPQFNLLDEEQIHLGGFDVLGGRNLLGVDRGHGWDNARDEQNGDNE